MLARLVAWLPLFSIGAVWMSERIRYSGQDNFERDCHAINGVLDDVSVQDALWKDGSGGHLYGEDLVGQNYINQLSGLDFGDIVERGEDVFLQIGVKTSSIVTEAFDAAGVVGAESISRSSSGSSSSFVAVKDGTVRKEYQDFAQRVRNGMSQFGDAVSQGGRNVVEGGKRTYAKVSENLYGWRVVVLGVVFCGIASSLLLGMYA